MDFAEKMKEARMLGRIEQIYFDCVDNGDMYSPIMLTFEDVDGKKVVICYGYEVMDASIKMVDYCSEWILKDQIDRDLFCWLMARRVFGENGVSCPFIFPLNISNTSDLINDARYLLDLKRQGKQAEFTFQRTKGHGLEWIEQCARKKRRRRFEDAV